MPSPRRGELSDGTVWDVTTWQIAGFTWLRHDAHVRLAIAKIKLQVICSVGEVCTPAGFRTSWICGAEWRPVRLQAHSK